MLMQASIKLTNSNAEVYIVIKLLYVISSILIDHTRFNFSCHYKRNSTPPCLVIIGPPS